MKEAALLIEEEPGNDAGTAQLVLAADDLHFGSWQMHHSWPQAVAEKAAEQGEQPHLHMKWMLADLQPWQGHSALEHDQAPCAVMQEGCMELQGHGPGLMHGSLARQNGGQRRLQGLGAGAMRRWPSKTC